MNYFASVLLGIIIIAFTAFFLSFYHDLKVRWRKNRIKALRHKNETARTASDIRKERLKIPGYYEENDYRSDNGTYITHSGTTII